jgi:hypothetical protein
MVFRKMVECGKNPRSGLRRGLISSDLAKLAPGMRSLVPCLTRLDVREKVPSAATEKSNTTKPNQEQCGTPGDESQSPFLVRLVDASQSLWQLVTTDRPNRPVPLFVLFI